MPTIDFNKIFSTNASSTPFTWSDSDYLVGWDSIENTPPSRQQFNALHMISDLKDQELNNVKAPINSPTFTGDPKAPTPGWNDNDTSIATTAFVQHWISQVGSGITDYSLGQTGYVKFGNGWMVQWGSESTTPSTGVTFPVSFPNQCCAFVGIDSGVSTGGEHTFVCSMAPAIDNSGIITGGWRVEASTWSSTVYMSWIAIGY